MRATWQVHPNGIRHVRSDGRQNEWKTPRGRPIKHATANARQVAISLEGGEVIYFELGEAGALQEMDKKEFGGEVTAPKWGQLTGRRAPTPGLPCLSAPSR